MQVVGIRAGDGADDRLERVVGRVVDRLGRAGRVGVVRYDATIADGASPDAGGDVTYELGADGDWVASGTGRSVPDALDDLAPACDYAVVVGADVRYPTVVVGDPATGADPAIVVRSPEDLDPEALLETVDGGEPHETIESLVARAEASPDADRAGAVATFTGRVRARDDPDDPRTEYLEFEKYEGVADERLAAIRADLESREGVRAVELYHRTGVVRGGEHIVHVVVLAGHRDEAFPAVEDGIDRLKAEVPLFKREVTVEDEFWVHERS